MDREHGTEACTSGDPDHAGLRQRVTQIALQNGPGQAESAPDQQSQQSPRKAYFVENERRRVRGDTEAGSANEQ